MSAPEQPPGLSSVPPEGRGRRRLRVDPILFAVVVGGAGLRFWGIGAQSLWYDEWLTTEAVQGGLGDLLLHVRTSEGIPVPWFVLMWGWARVVGDGDVALRLLSAVAGTATIPVAAAIATRLTDRRTGRIAGLLVAVHPMLVWYSQEARPYALLSLVTAGSFLLTVRWIQGGGRAEVISWSLAGVAVVSVHYFGAFVVAAEAVALLVVAHVPWRRLLLALTPTAFVLAAMAPVALDQSSHETNRTWIAAFPLSARLREAGRSALLGPSVTSGRLWLVPAAAVVLGVVLLVVRGSARERRGAALAAGVGAGAVALALGVTAVATDVVLSRYLIGSLVPLTVAVAVGLGTARAWRVGLVGVGVLVAVSLWTVVSVARDPQLQRADWREVTDVVRSGGGRRVLVVDGRAAQASPLRRYLPGAHRLEPGERVRVDGIDVVALRSIDRPCNFLVGRPCALLFLGSTPPVAGSLPPPERLDLGPLAVDRYTPRSPISVTPADLVAPDRLPGATLYLVCDEPSGCG